MSMKMGLTGNLLRRVSFTLAVKNVDTLWSCRHVEPPSSVNILSDPNRQDGNRVLGGGVQGSMAPGGDETVTG